MHHFKTIGSTNTYALEQARLGAAHGCFYVADEQTAGRGRSDHRWQSVAAEGLYLSVLLRVASEQVAWLPLMAGLAAHAAIRDETGLVVDLRWPNDILAGERKLAGILVEAAAGAAVVGIGINLHQRSFAEGLAATSLDLEMGGRVSRERVLVGFVKALERELGGFSAGEIVRRVEEVSSWVKGRRVEVHGPQACVGVTDGLDGRGFLRVVTGDGVVVVTTGGIRKTGSRE